MCGTVQDKGDSRNSPTGAVQGRCRFKNIFDVDFKIFSTGKPSVSFFSDTWSFHFVLLSGLLELSGLYVLTSLNQFHLLKRS